MSVNLEIAHLELYFPSQKGWKVVEIGTDKVDRRITVSGSPIRCIDRDFGSTPEGYDPESVPLAPAWLGAVDGVASFLRGSTEERMEEAVKKTESIGFKPAYHGDYIKGYDGCAYRRALLEGKFDGLPKITRAEHELLSKKMGIHSVLLDRPKNRTTELEGFILNESYGTTILPDAGRFYPIDIWFANQVGITNRRALPIIAKCGELLLPEEHKTLFVVRD